jgi:UDP-glucose 4-epimerase
MKKILVTGGSGFIGKHVVNSLVKRNYKVTILDLINPKRKDIKFVKGSILNKKLIKSLLKKNKLVFHLAALSDINKTIKNPTKTILVNILGTERLLEESQKSNVKRFIFASTYYPSKDNVKNVYTTSKNTSELMIKNYNLLYGLNYTILKYPTAYGPDNRQVDAISIFVKKALRNLNIIIHGNGNQKRNYVHVHDIGEGSMLGLKKKLENKIFFLASKKNIKIIDIAKIIIRLTNSKSNIVISKKKKRINDFSSNLTYPKKQNKIAEWKPEYDLIAGLKQYIKTQKNL